MKFESSLTIKAVRNGVTWAFDEDHHQHVLMDFDTLRPIGAPVQIGEPHIARRHSERYKELYARFYGKK